MSEITNEFPPTNLDFEKSGKFSLFRKKVITLIVVIFFCVSLVYMGQGNSINKEYSRTENPSNPNGIPRTYELHFSNNAAYSFNASEIIPLLPPIGFVPELPPGLPLPNPSPQPQPIPPPENIISNPEVPPLPSIPVQLIHLKDMRELNKKTQELTPNQTTRRIYMFLRIKQEICQG